MSVKEKLILQVMEEMEVSRDVAVEIVGGKEEEEEEVDEVTKVVLIHPQTKLSVSQDLRQRIYMYRSCCKCHYILNSFPAPLVIPSSPC